jgi:hypothetical protein
VVAEEQPSRAAPPCRTVCHPLPVLGDYFGDLMVNRQRLIWTVATRRQLERWEPYVARSVRAGFARPGSDIPDADIWAAAAEHHFALIAARHLLTALELAPPSNVPIDPTIRAELIEGRDLHEHWRENMEVFTTRPRAKEPARRSGKDFAARNPREGPYDWLAWSNKTGARLLPHVHAPGLHELLDAVEAEVLASDPTLSRFVPPREPSAWLYESGEWWPKPDDVIVL